MNYHLKRRGYDLGTVSHNQSVANNNDLSDWQEGKPILLQGVCLSQLNNHQANIKQASSLYHAILEQECEPILAKPPYSTRLEHKFELLGCSFNEGDDQEIETILFDAVEQDKVLAEDLWMKVSWLSFYEDDASLRFRFSFGEDNVEDVAADSQRQHYAALLADSVFPESSIITKNKSLHTHLTNILNCNTLSFVERIVYFNASNGGAYLHHDRERGHAGVVYAQLSGATYWLALPKQMLISEIIDFIKHCRKTAHWPSNLDNTMQQQLSELGENREALSIELDSFANSPLIHLINETEAFVQQLIQNGHGRMLQAGDVLLLPQENDSDCCWHTVFTLGEEPGEALSFAMRRN